jgi:hypothetical protein
VGALEPGPLQLGPLEPGPLEPGPLAIRAAGPRCPLEPGPLAARAAGPLAVRARAAGHDALGGIAALRLGTSNRRDGEIKAQRALAAPKANPSQIANLFRLSTGAGRIGYI